MMLLVFTVHMLNCHFLGRIFIILPVIYIVLHSQDLFWNKLCDIMYIFFLIFYGNEYVYRIAKNLQDYR